MLAWSTGDRRPIAAILDTDGVIVEVNDEWRRLMLAADKEGLSGAPGEEYLAVAQSLFGPNPADLKTLETGIRSVLSGSLATFTGEVPGLNSNDSHNLLIVVVPHHGKAGDCALVLHHLVISQAHSEARVLESENLRHAILGSAVDAILVSDDHGMIESFNRAAERMFLYSSEEVTGRNVRMLMPEPDRSKHDHYLRNYRETGREKIIGRGQEVQGRRKDGTSFPLDLSVAVVRVGARTQFIGTCRDITQRKLAEQQLRESEQRNRTILETVVDGIITIDDQGIVCTVNPAVERIFGYVAQELVGQNIRLFMPEVSSKTHDGDLVSSLETDAKVAIGIGRETSGQRKDGTVFPLELSVSEMVIDGKVMFTGVVRDITERKKAAQQEKDLALEHEQKLFELESAQVQLERQGGELTALAEDLKDARDQSEAANLAKSEFLATMSHELRTPLNGVLGMADLLLASQLSGEQQRQVAMIKQSGEGLLAQLNDILDLSKIEAGRLTLEIVDFDLQGLLDAVSALWNSRATQKGLSFTIEVAEGAMLVLKSDPGRVRQILFNFVSNAIKFTEQGSVEVRVSQKRSADDGRYETRFEVIDSGVGVPHKVRPRLFHKFTQADSSTTRRYGGTGLGLCICKQLSELLGGSVGMESEVGRGSNFWFTILSEAGDTTRVAEDLWTTPAEFTEPHTQPRKLRILVAEDNYINQAVIRELLAKSGHEVDMVDNGVEAVAALRGASSKASFDLVLMDVQMPEMDGLTATGKIRALPGPVARVPIIALTANAMAGDREKYLASGMTDYVSKPISPQALFAAIYRVSDTSLEACIEAQPKGSDQSLSDQAFDEVEVLLDALEEKREGVGTA